VTGLPEEFEMSICVCPCTIVVSARVGKTEQIKDGDRAVRQQAILDETWTSKIQGLVHGLADTCRAPQQAAYENTECFEDTSINLAFTECFEEIYTNLALLSCHIRP
jgi:hypothetical protein